MGEAADPNQSRKGGKKKKNERANVACEAEKLKRSDGRDIGLLGKKLENRAWKKGDRANADVHCSAERAPLERIKERKP